MAKYLVLLSFTERKISEKNLILGLNLYFLESVVSTRISVIEHSIGLTDKPRESLKMEGEEGREVGDRHKAKRLLQSEDL